MGFLEFMFWRTEALGPLEIGLYALAAPQVDPEFLQHLLYVVQVLKAI